ncbi:hypothetical protein P5673_012204 [Acropora cervicornis]|uniref:Integrase catalytic domain-containing protein n=1 Tax=Acropora cervicornis TaxID=6130 RepID=A0AAD9QMJ2_ACRCE|nr:hypothetical protein P5673_012204 [Acropora cervicornis]
MALVEEEALPVVDALDEAIFFVLGCSDLISAVDHKPLLKVFSDRSLKESSNARLRNLKEKTLRYKFRMVHVPGAQARSKGLIDWLRRLFGTFGIPDECAMDGGPEFTASATCRFLQDWGVCYHLSSVAQPHSKCRAEIGVKTVKCLITNNPDPQGSLNTDALQGAMLQYRSTPDPATKLSLAQSVFGRPMKDFIPILPAPLPSASLDLHHPTWNDTLAAREEALRNRHMREAERWTVCTRRLPPLAVSHYVRIQDQTGPHPNKWDKTDIIIEVRQFDQHINHPSQERRDIPVQAPQPQHTIYVDFRYTTQLLAKPAASPTLRPTTCPSTTPASNRLTPETTPSQSPTSTVPTAAAPAHLSTSSPESAVNTPSCPHPEHPHHQRPFLRAH